MQVLRGRSPGLGLLAPWLYERQLALDKAAAANIYYYIIEEPMFFGAWGFGGGEKMREQIIATLTSKNDKFSCAFADKIISESSVSNEWYAYWDAFASLLDHPKSLVRNRVIYILAANVQWDNENRFDAILPDFLSHITDEKPITARQCIKALAQIGLSKAQYTETILSALKNADLSGYKDSMRPLIERDTAETIGLLTAGRH